jgi:predicted AAA+ superfamily ATPase
MYIQRIYDNLEEYIAPGKVLILFGPRQVGKTTLIQNYLKKTKLKYRFETGENIRTQNVLSVPDQKVLSEYVQGFDLLVIDEAQLISNVGRSLKLLVDTNPNLAIIATGSSSFELAGQVGEPLTGRKKTLTLFPISILELSKTSNLSILTESLPEYLIYGLYPEVLNLKDNSSKQVFLKELVDSYLLKDILALEKVKNSKTLFDLLRLLAFQVGSEVSLSELAQKISVDYKTVARYLDLFEKAYIIFEIRGFSKNLRSEINSKSKYYFFDNGIRNAIISSFNELDLRQDVGALWENFMFVERWKKRSYTNIVANVYFWRTWSQQEIDLIEEREGKLFGYEFKFNKESVKVPKAWLENYPDSSVQLVNSKNFGDFIV